jgi:hypothetical protein
MKRLIASAMLVLMLGCTTGNKYVEGTMTQLGVYAPIDGSIYGCEVVNYMNGCKVTSISNLPFKVDRVYSATNSYLWGMVTTTESTHTKVEMTK